MGLMESFSNRTIELLEPKSVMRMDDVLSLDDPETVVICDFNIQGMETAIFDEVFKTKIGTRTVLNVDHHVPVPAMMRFISSANLASNYVRKYGVPAPAKTSVKIHHTDCDSIISAAMMRGLIEPESRFEEAAIAADHTGAENPIADLLQSLELERDISFSLEMLDIYLKNGSLPPRAVTLVDERTKTRLDLKNMVESGVFKMIDGVAYADIDYSVDAGLLPSLLPDAKAIVVSMPTESGRKNIKVRLTPASPEGSDISRMNLENNFGGRWNAGSNKRGGGTTLSAAEFAQLVAKNMKSE